MPSHSDEPDCKKDIPEWVSPFHVAGNDQADRITKSVAARCAIKDLNITRRVKRHTYILNKI